MTPRLERAIDAVVESLPPFARRRAPELLREYAEALLEAAREAKP